ncbi:MAG: septal ring lytic transglycosylase RlpA family protein [Alphaproteobacteria bacterium]|jgi:rare lipoprotein A|nr:septal ring lytic transglycosylase RlpA family protein [Alphaproteobacteria bacterium]
MTVFSRSPVPRLAIILLAGAGVAGLAAPGAEARRKPAPITYAPQGERPETVRQGQGQEGRAGDTAASTERETGKRIEFRYPDQPGMVYGPEGARAANGDDPIAFSSSQAAIAPDKARAYAHTRTPRAAAGKGARDRAISPGGFDARATAARIAAEPAPAAEAPAASPSASASASPAETYSVGGATVRPQGGESYDETGIASWYGPGFDGNPTANGETFDQEAMTAAHPTLPLPSLVQVVNLDNDREVVLRVNDRGPFIDGRMIDVSRRAAEVLGFEEAGEARVRVRYLGPAPVAGAPYKSATSVRSEQANPQTGATVDLEKVPRQLNRPPQPGENGHMVQLGSFADIANAHRLTASLEATLPVDIRQARVRGADYFRVLVGPFASETRAQAVRTELSTRGIADGIVLDEAKLSRGS